MHRFIKNEIVRNIFENIDNDEFGKFLNEVGKEVNVQTTTKDLTDETSDRESEGKTTAKSKNTSDSKGEENIIFVLRKNLYLIIERLNGITEQKQKFLQNYPKLRGIRTKCSKSLSDIGNEMHGVRKNCNIARLVSNTTSAVGGAASLGWIPPLAPFAVALTLTGCVTSTVTSIADVSIMKKKLAEAQDEISVFNKSLKEMPEVLGFEDFSETIDSLSCLDMTKDKFHKLGELLKAGLACKTNAERIKYVKDFVKFCCNNLKFGSFSTASKVAMGISVLAIILQFFNVSKKLTCTLQFSALLPIAYDISSMAYKGVVGSEFVTNKPAVAFGLALDAISMLLTTIDLCNGSQSENGRTLIEISEKIDEETKVLDEAFKELVK